MYLTMNWEDLSFKASDVVKLVIGLVTAVFFASSIKNSVNNMNDTVEEIRKTQIENTKNNAIKFELMQSQINANTTDLKLMNQRIDNLEDSKK